MVVVVTSLFNLVISSFPDNMHVLSCMSNVVQVCSFVKPFRVFNFVIADVSIVFKGRGLVESYFVHTIRRLRLG